MPVQWFTGFEAADTNELVALGGSVTVGAAYKRSGNYGCRIVVPQSTSTAYIAVANGYDANGNPASISRTAYTLGFGMRLTSLPQTTGTWEYLLYVAYGTTHRASLRIGKDGTLRLHVGASGSPYIASFGPIELGRWYFCELAVLFDRYVWRMDGQIVAQGLASPGGSMNTASLGKRYNLASQGYTLDVDDIYTCDDAVFYGPTARVARLNASVNGTSFGWTANPPEEPPPVPEP
ncbi:MAG: hypothetical protein HRF50_16145 [Phycisphaerae bacterium]